MILYLLLSYTHIFSTTHPKAIKHAIDLGIAMQLTNIARDVVADAKLGRIYLPQTFLKKNINEKAMFDNHRDEEGGDIHELMQRYHI